MELFNHFLNLYKNKKQIAVLSYVYLYVALFFVLIAGICALVNQQFGVKMLVVSVVALGTFCVNIVTWALVCFVIDAITERAKEKEAEDKKKTLIAAKGKK